MKVTIASFTTTLPAPLRSSGHASTISNEKHPDTTMELSEDGTHLVIEGFKNRKGPVHVPLYNVAWYQVEEAAPKKARGSKKKTTLVPKSAMEDKGDPPAFTGYSGNLPSGDDAA